LYLDYSLLQPLFFFFKKHSSLSLSLTHTHSLTHKRIINPSQIKLTHMVSSRTNYSDNIPRTLFSLSIILYLNKITFKFTRTDILYKKGSYALKEVHIWLLESECVRFHFICASVERFRLRSSWSFDSAAVQREVCSERTGPLPPASVNTCLSSRASLRDKGLERER